MESRGYTVTTCYNQTIYGYEGLTQGFTFDQYKAEIDANRPVLIHVEGHTMVGFGYDSSNQTIYIKNTWDYSTHTMTWGEDYNDMTHYAVTVLNLDPNQSVQYGDTSNNPIIVNSLPLSATGNTNDYTNTLGYSSKDVFYKLLLPVQADNVTINTNGSDYDTYLRFYNSFQNQTNADNNSGEGSCSQLTGLNLSANTAYYVCVEGYNSNNGNYSLNIFIPGYEYLTLECNDSYGDGWSNIQYTSDNLPNSISVLVNEEIVIQDFTFNDGAQATTTFGLFPGDTVTTSFNPGSWSEECSYRILDSNNIELASGDESTDISFVYRENTVLPSNLTATIVNNNDVTLQWGLGNRQSDQSVSKSPEKEFEDSELRALTGFKVYRNNNLIATLSSVYTYTDLNLANNTYQYKITALYGSEESQPSNLASVTINMGNPQIVENVEVLYYEDAILLAWDNVVLDTNNHSLTPDYYNIYASDTTDEENFIIIGTSNENFFSILIEEISFNPAFFKVTAVKEN